MKQLLQTLLVLLVLSVCTSVNAQTPAFPYYTKPWNASWITVPGESANGYGVYLFRKNIELATKPASFVIHVSADNRYKLFVNGKLVSLGPARGDVNHWNFETVDIAPHLQAGKNSIAAKVWNEAELRPQAQMTLRTGFILQGATSAEEIVNTDESWNCTRDNSYQPIKITHRDYYGAGPGEQIDMKFHIRNWEGLSYDDNDWKKSQTLFRGVPKNGPEGGFDGWMLTPSIIPQMEMTPQRLAQVRKADGIVVPSSFPATKTALTIPANTMATLLLDQSHLTNAYFNLLFSGGKNGSITISYTEALFSNHPQKGNRNEVEGKTFIGRHDSIISDGSRGQLFTTLWWRTFRYIQLRVATKEEPLIIDDLYGTFTGYPFQFNAKWNYNNPELYKMLDIGWRTARLCAAETYMDCPYYEQLQYIGDTRIQAMVSLYNSGDDRLLKHAINLMDQSRQPEGVTFSRHPSHISQFIPTFSLWYIGVLYDYWMYGPDTAFIKTRLAGTRQVLNYFRNYQQADGSLKNVPYWMFTDWVEDNDWQGGVGPVGKDGSSALQDLQLLWAYQLAAKMEDKIGLSFYGVLYRQYATQLKQTIRKKYWDRGKKLFADRIEKDKFSQHTNTLAILTGVVDSKETKALGQQLLTNKELAAATIYFKYYLHLALVKAGQGDHYLDWLSIWRENISMGLTTWTETSNVNATRSDCHAWGCSPNIEFFRTILGIDSDAPGFAKVKIEPHLGNIKDIGGEIPHPKGTIAVQYTNNNNKWIIDISLPSQTTGSLIWKGRTFLLKAGKNSLQIAVQ